MSRKLRIHFVLLVDRAPAPHQQSGVKETPVGQLGSGMANVAACDPTIRFSEWDSATSEWWAVACQDCIKTSEWQAATKLSPHPKAHLIGRPGEAEDVSAAIAGCCGG